MHVGQRASRVYREAPTLLAQCRKWNVTPQPAPMLARPPTTSAFVPGVQGSGQAAFGPKTAFPA